MQLAEQVISLARNAGERIPNSMRQTLGLWYFALTKIPALMFVSPSVVEVTDSRCVVRIPLNRRTRNHVGSMYFGVLAAGADCAGGLIAMDRIRASGENVSLLFKDFKADFLQRVEGDCLFTCDDGEAISAMVEETLSTGERINRTVNVIATVPSKSGDEPVARFELTLSLKRQ